MFLRLPRAGVGQGETKEFQSVCRFPPLGMSLTPASIQVTPFIFREWWGFVVTRSQRSEELLLTRNLATKKETWNWSRMNLDSSYTPSPVFVGLEITRPFPRLLRFRLHISKPSVASMAPGVVMWACNSEQ